MRVSVIALSLCLVAGCGSEADGGETGATTGTVQAVSIMRSHACALLDGGSVHCWGDNQSGQLGYGNTERVGDDEEPATVGSVALGAAATAISVGDEHSCALLEGGAVKCWGGNLYGQLGLGNTDSVGDDELPDSVPAIDLGEPAVHVAAGGSMTCAVLQSGDLRCWGAGAFLGSLGAANIGDDEAPSSAPIVPLGVKVASISASISHVCVVSVSGGVRCFGDAGSAAALGYSGQAVGGGVTPADAGDVNIGFRAASVVTGPNASCVVGDAKQLSCWGPGEATGWGPSGAGVDASPAQDGALPVVDVERVALGAVHGAAVVQGKVRVWGGTANDALGLPGSASLTAASAATLPLGYEVQSLAAGRFTTCVVGTDRNVRCWGGVGAVLGRPGIESEPDATAAAIVKLEEL